MKNYQAYLLKFICIGMMSIFPALSHADSAGDKLLKKCANAMYKAKTLQADYTYECQPETNASHHGIIKLKKPRLTFEKHPCVPQ